MKVYFTRIANKQKRDLNNINEEMSSAKWMIVNGVKYPVDDDHSPRVKSRKHRHAPPRAPPPPKKTMDNRVIRTATGSDMRPLVKRTKKKWHWSIGKESGWMADYEKAIRVSGISIHGASEEWSAAEDRPKHRVNQLNRFKEKARSGDEIYMWCGGKVRAKGIFTGEIFPISTEEAQRMSTSLPEDKRKSSGSFMSMVEGWGQISNPQKGCGKRPTLYEIRPDMKNYVNYH